MHNCNFLFQKGKHEIELLFQKRIGGKREWEAKGGEKEKKKIRKERRGRKGREKKLFPFTHQILTPSLTKSVPLDKFLKIRLTIMKSYKWWSCESLGKIIPPSLNFFI